MKTRQLDSRDFSQRYGGVCVCVCVLDGEGSLVFVSTAVVVQLNGLAADWLQ